MTLAERHILADVVSAILDMAVPDGTCVDVLATLRLERIARLLHLAVARLENATDRQFCQDILELLPEVAAERLLRAPALCELLRTGSSGKSLPHLLEVERIACVGEHTQSWNAMGDCWLGMQSPGAGVELSEQDRRFWSPKLACGIPLDLSLPERLTTPSAGLQNPMALLESDKTEALAQLDKALQVLEQAYPFGQKIFAALVSNLVLRNDAARWNECWGASSGAAIGRIVIVNAANGTDPLMLAESLLHEATHCALDCVELARPLFSIAGVSRESIVSPWTGNPLTPHAFVHACVVWSVLLQYWTACAERFGVVARSQSRQNFIRDGFKRMNSQPALFRPLNPLSATVVDLVSAIASR
jgi:HEXXH motif-containing protein